MVLAAWGGFLRRRDPTTLAVAAAGAFGFLLALGDASFLTRDLYTWALDHFSFLRSFREPQKGVALLVLAYAFLGAIALSSSSLRHSAVSHSTAKEPAAPSIQSAVRQPTGLSVETSSIQVSPTPGRLVARRERFILDRAAQRSEPEVLVSSEEEAGLRRYADLLRAKSFETSNRAAATDDAPFEIKPLEIAELGLRQLTIQPLEGSESD